jgi:hypothetical protein
VIAVAVAALVWREQVRDRRRTPKSDTNEQSMMFDGCRLTSSAMATAYAPANRTRLSPAGWEGRPNTRQGVRESRGADLLRRYL